MRPHFTPLRPARRILALMGMALLLAVLLPTLALAAADAGLAPAEISAAGYADLVVTNAKVLTIDRVFSIKEAIAVKNGMIRYVGSAAGAEKWIGPETAIYDLDGKVIMPGINESHAHVAMFGASRPPVTLDLTSASGVDTVGEVVDLLAAKVATVAPGTWIRGVGWDPWLFPDVGKADLDGASPDNPVILIDMSAHNAWVNSKALEIAGITKDTPDPEGGIIVRDPATGEPTGMLRELSALGLVMQKVPLWSDQELRDSVVSALAELSKNGVTSVTEAALGSGGNNYQGGVLGERVIEIYKDLYAEGALPARVSILLLFGEYGGISVEDLQNGLDTYEWPTGYDPRWLRFPGAKLFADGIPVTYTSWMWDEYVGGGFGSLTIPGADDQEKYDNLIAMIRAIISRGYQLGIHATGDRAISAALDGIELGRADNPFNLNQHYIIHGEFISAEDAARAARMRVGINMQPVIQGMIADIEYMFVGPERAAYEWPYRTAYAAGLNVCSSSDMPVTYPDWRLGVEQIVLREGFMSGKPSGPDQVLPLEVALRTYTINGARQDAMAWFKGSIEPGKAADFCVLDKDIMTVDPHDISTIQVLMTMVSGKVVYDNSGGAFLQ